MAGIIRVSSITESVGRGAHPKAQSDSVEVTCGSNDQVRMMRTANDLVVPALDEAADIRKPPVLNGTGRPGVKIGTPTAQREQRAIVSVLAGRLEGERGDRPMTSSIPSSSLSSRKMVTAFFDGRSDAEDAIERLVDAGISRDGIRFMPGDERDPPDDPGATRRSEPRGFWNALDGWFLPDEDRNTYAEGLRRGGYLISVNATDEQYERVIDILEDEGTIDMDERADSWRAEGWTGSSTADVVFGSTANPTTADRVVSGAGETTGTEQPDVGRRDVSHGRRRIRSYVVESSSKSR